MGGKVGESHGDGVCDGSLVVLWRYPFDVMLST